MARKFATSKRERARQREDNFLSLSAKNPVRPSEGMAEGGCGGNSALPSQKIEASSATLLLKARHHRKILFSLREEKIRRAQNEKSKEYFSVVWRAKRAAAGRSVSFAQRNFAQSLEYPKTNFIMKILAIETSCDETAIALVKASGGLRNPKFKILKNLVASQIKIHRPFGGVVPNLAKREHLKNLPILLKKTLNSKFYILNSIDLIAVTVGPGLEPCLWTGINFAKNLAKEYKKPLLGVSHLEGHLYSFLLSQKTVNSKFKIQNSKFPAVALLVSGGHTILLLMKDLTHHKKLGETRDDAVGEAFDKVARLLNLLYPGGPEIEKLAKSGDPNAINFPRPMLNQKNYDFSFSGLKTAVLYYLKNNENSPLRKVSRSPSGHGVRPHSDERGRESSGRASGWASETPSFREASSSDIAASFQQAAFDVIISKTLRAAKEYKAKSIMISGGVAVNKTLQKQFKKEIKKHHSLSSFHFPPSSFCGDNAAMIAVAGYFNFLQKKKRRIIAQSNLNLV